MTWHAVARVEEVTPGKPKVVSVEGKGIGIFYEGGRHFAVLNFCPHFGAPVCQGRVFGAVTADGPGKLTYDSGRLVLRCPWHRWEFDLKTGQALTPIRQRLRTYPVQLGEQLEIANGEDSGTTPSASENALATFELRIDGAVIWIEF